MDIIVIVLLVVLAIFLVVVEVLLLPGVTVAAFGALAAGIYAAYLTYDIAGNDCIYCVISYFNNNCYDMP